MQLFIPEKQQFEICALWLLWCVSVLLFIYLSIEVMDLNFPKRLLSGCTPAFSGISLNSGPYFPLVWSTMAGQNNAKQYFVIYSFMDLINNCTFFSYKCKTKPVQMRDGGVVSHEGEFILNQVQRCFLRAKWRVMTCAGSELLILEKPSKSNWSTNHSLDSQSHIVLLYSICGPETSPLCLPEA